MPNRQKEERIERAIRMVSKLQENRRCVNCNSLGPQYVCITFWTFVCTSCCAIHREFSHRVKSISMTKFSFDDVGALETGGNQRAREIYMKELDLQCHPFPDNSNPYRLRDFIKHVYIDRKYTGGKSMDKIPRLKEGHLHRKESGNYTGLVSSHGGEKAGPSGRSDNVKILRAFNNDRSSHFSEGGGRCGSQKRSVVRFEIVDDRVKNGESVTCRKSTTIGLDGSKEKSKPCNTETRLCENTTYLDSRLVNESGIFQRNVESEYLIDFNTNTESSEQRQLTYVRGDGCSNPSTGNSVASLNSVSNSNSLESLLSELEVPNLSSMDSTAAVSYNFDILSCTGDLGVPSAHDSRPIVKNGRESDMATFGNVSYLPSNVCTVSTVSEAEYTPFAVASSECSEYMHQNPKYLDTGAEAGISTGAIIPFDDQPFESVHIQQAESGFGQISSMISGIGSYSSITAEASPRGRKELPMDLFTTASLPLPQVPWQSIQAPGLQYDTQALTNFPSSSYNSARAANPFNFNIELPQSQNQYFVTAGPSSLLASPSGMPPFPSQLAGQRTCGNDGLCLPPPPREVEDRGGRRNPFE